MSKTIRKPVSPTYDLVKGPSTLNSIVARKRAFKKASNRKLRHMKLATELPQNGGYRKFEERWSYEN